MAQLLYSVLPTPRRKMESVSVDATVADCVERMTTRDIGSLLVMDGDKLVGLISERDIVRLCVSCGLDPCKVKAKDVAYLEVSILSVDDSVEKAMKIITNTKRRHVLVKENKEIIGIISIGDLMFHLLNQHKFEKEQLVNYIES